MIVCCLLLVLIHIFITGAVSFFGRKGILLLQQRKRQMRRYGAFITSMVLNSISNG